MLGENLWTSNEGRTKAELFHLCFLEARGFAPPPFLPPCTALGGRAACDAMILVEGAALSPRSRRRRSHDGSNRATKRLSVLVLDLFQKTYLFGVSAKRGKTQHDYLSLAPAWPGGLDRSPMQNSYKPPTSLLACVHTCFAKLLNGRHACGSIRCGGHGTATHTFSNGRQRTTAGGTCLPERRQRATG